MVKARLARGSCCSYHRQAGPEGGEVRLHHEEARGALSDPSSRLTVESRASCSTGSCHSGGGNENPYPAETLVRGSQVLCLHMRLR